jgi:hypothetical protein
MTIILGDTHGRDIWKKFANRGARLVFIGDYFDSFDKTGDEQIANFQDIMEYKKQNPDTICLIGNHDYHYIYPGSKCSGFNRKDQYKIGHVLKAHKDDLKMAVMINNYLCTHAGVTYTWLKNTLKLTPEDDIVIGVPIDEYINDVYKYTPDEFLFNGWDGYGNDVTQSPIWVRPPSLVFDAYDPKGLKQVVGHTGQLTIDIRDDKFFFIDCLGSSGEALQIDDNGDYTVIT